VKVIVMPQVMAYMNLIMLLTLTVSAQATLTRQVVLALVATEAAVVSIALEVDTHTAAAKGPECTLGVAATAHVVQVGSHVVALLAVVGLSAAGCVLESREIFLTSVVRCGS
jgi:hypothetical protein